MAMVSISAPFRKTVTEIFQQTGVDWLERLPATIRELEERWSLRVLDPFSLSINYVAPAVRSDGSPVVLKISVPVGEFFTELAALQLFDGQGMARLLDYDTQQGALLLERLVPGRTLKDIEDDELATRVAAGVMQRLWKPLPSKHPFPTVEGWARGFERMRQMFSGGTGPLPARITGMAESLFAGLLPTSQPAMLLHGDLHHNNILSVETGAGLDWKAIDPKGVAGEPEFEISAFLLNPFVTLPPKIELQRVLSRRIAIFAEMLNLNPDRILRWGTARAVLSAWWTIEDHGSDWQNAIGIAEALAELIEEDVNLTWHSEIQ